jgi:Na+-transporting NADH:ubiquinone oxidoreductase subunit NqrB
MITLSLPQLSKENISTGWLLSFIKWFIRDPRHYQVMFLTIFLFYGLVVLHWDADPVIYAAAFASCLVTQYAFIVFKTKDLNSLKSALISSLSLCLMLKTNHPEVMMLSGVLTVSGKFIFRYHGKHIFNPTNFGIIITILLTGSAWISPGQWGNNGLLVFSIGILGLIVLLRVKRFDTAMAFLLTFCALSFFRSVMLIGWSFDVFLHQFTSGTFLLFTFFMITDPVSTPSSKTARIIWSSMVAALAFYLASFQFVKGAPLWALFFISPLTILFDKIFVHKKFSWL